MKGGEGPGLLIDGNEGEEMSQLGRACECFHHVVILPSWEDGDSPGGLSQESGGGLTGGSRQHWDPQLTLGQGGVNSEKTEGSDPEFPCATGFQCWM